jgi:colanic acid/amylovoran biosynthesis protein
MKILVINLHSSRNAGDDMLTRLTVEQLLQSFDNPELILAMNDPASYNGTGTTVGSFMTWLKQQDGRWRPVLGPLALWMSLCIVFWYRIIGTMVLRCTPRCYRSLIRAYLEADLVISSAGNYLYSSGLVGVPFLVAVYTMAYGWLAGKPLYTMPQTVGPLRRSWERCLTKWIVGKMRLMFVRDNVSWQTLKAIGVSHVKCRLVPDIAFALPPSPPEQGKQLLHRNGVDLAHRPLLGVTLINWGAQSRLFTRQETYETAVAAAIRAFVTHYQGQAVLFSQVQGPTLAEDDRVPAGRVRERLMKLGDRVTFIEGSVEPETLKAAYGQMDLFLGTRLHSNIFALSEGVPALTIQYQYKTRGVLSMLDLENWVVEIEHVTAKNLTTCLEKLWAEQDDIRVHLKKIMPSIVVQSSQIGATVAADFAGEYA